MKWLSIIQIIAIVIASGLAVLSSLTKIKEGNKLTKWGKISILGIILSLGVAIWLESLKAEDEKEKDIKEKDRYESIIKKADTTSLKLDSTLLAESKSLSKADSSLKALNNLQSRTNKIISDLSNELKIQKQINSSTRNLLVQNTQISKRADSIISGLERIEDPLFPANFYLSVITNTQNGQMKMLADTLRKLYEKYNTGKFAHKDSIGIVTREGEISVFNYDTLLKSINFNFINRRAFYIGVTDDSIPLQGNRLIYLRSSYDGNFLNESIPLKKKLCKLTYNFKEGIIKFELILTYYDSESSRPPLFLSLRDLVGYYLCVSPGDSDLKIESFAFIFGNKILRSVQFANNYGRTISGAGNLLMHKILPDDLKLVFIDWTSYFLEYR